MIATTPRISRRSTSVRGRSPTRNADIHATRTTNAVTPAKKTREATPVRRHTPRDKTVIAASGGPSTASTPAKRAREKSPAAGRSPAPSKTTKSPTGSRTSSVSKGSRSTPRSTPEKDVPSDADASEGEDDRMEEINKRETMKKMKEAEKKAFEKCKMAGVKNQGVVKKNDVIWARYQQAPLWPALVVNAQPKKITYVFFPLPKDGSIPTTRFSCNPKNVFRLSMGEDTPKGADRHFYSVLMEAKRYIWNRGDLEGSEAILRPDSKPMTEAQLRHELPQAVDAVLEMRKKQKDEADKKKAERDKKELDAAKEAEKNKADTSKEKDKTGVRKDEETAEKQMEAVEDKNDELRKDKEVAREENDVARELMAKEKAKKEGERETTKKQDDDVIIIEQKQEVEEEANKGEKEAVEEDNDEASEDEEEQVDKSRKENMEEDSEEMSSEFTYGVDYYYLVENPKEGRAYLEKLTKKYARIFKKNETDLKRKEDGAVEDAEGKEPEVQKEQQDDEVNEPLLKKPRRVRNWEPEMPGSFTSYAEETVVEKMDTGFLEAPEPATQKTTRLCTMEVNDRFSRVVHDNYERIMEALYNTDNVRNFVVPPRGHFSCSFSSATRFLSAYNSDFLFERIKEFVEKKSPESPSLHTYLLITYVLFPEIVAHCMSIYSGSSLGDAMFCLFGAKNAAASNKWCQSAGGASYGMSNGLKYVVVVGVLFLTSVCLSSIFFLPTIGNEYIAKEIAVPNVHDPHFRRKAQERDVSILKKKVEEADILPPPIPQPEIGGGDDSEARRVSVKEMMKFAWDGYRKYAWGANELRPISKTGHSASIFGSGSMGATIVDAIDTLWLMGLREEYEQARTWIKDNLDFKKLARGDISVFETNIRFVGGLLAIYALTNDKMFLQKAEDIAKILLPAFETPSGIPYALVNVQTGSAKNYGWASGGCSILSEFGSIQLEFDYLSNATGNPIYAQKAQRIRDVLSKLEKPDGLYPMYLHPQTGKWGQRDYSLGAMADSFYEYLLKQWVVTGKKDELTKREYEEAIFAMEKKMLFKSEPSGLWYFANLHGSRVEHKMEHLACFAGGMFVLHAVNEGNLTVKEHYLDLGAKIGDTCHESYNRSAIGIGPEAFRFTSDAEAKAISVREKYYMLRPEVVETWFYLWRATRNEKYRNWAWDVVQALEKYAKSPAGYSGIEDVYSLPVSKDDVQQSFLLAELFKYLYLIFAEDSVLPLDRWVLNTEAHPLPIRQ